MDNRELWDKLGREEPWYSVIADARYRGLAAPPESFWESGRRDVEVVLSQTRAVAPDLDLSRVMELGCGVGRMTRAFIPLCGRVYGVDWSGPHLDLARKHAPGAEYLEWSSRYFPRVSFALSVITLQHNPPDVQLRLVRVVLAALDTKGVALFQTATQGEPRPPSADFGLWSCPAPDIFRVIAEAKCVPLDVFTDSWTGTYGRSTTFIVRRQP